MGQTWVLDNHHILYYGHYQIIPLENVFFWFENDLMIIISQNKMRILYKDRRDRSAKRKARLDVVDHVNHDIFNTGCLKLHHVLISNI